MSRSERKYKLLSQQVQRKLKAERKLVLPDLIKALIDKSGVKTYNHHFFKDMLGGVNNIKMAQEEPFLVINRYPQTQYFMDQGQPSVNVN